MKLSDAGEFGLIEVIRNLSESQLVASHHPKESVGIGDDCAVLPVSGGGFLLLSTDTMVERRHFRRDFSTPRQIGRKLLAVNLSDIAAMGGSPQVVLLTIQAPADLPIDWVEELVEGIHEAGREFGVWIAGGDTVQSDTLAVGLSVLGAANRRPILRSGAKPGDTLWVSGSIGGAGAGLHLLQSGCVSDSIALIEKYQNPSPRIRLGERLIRSGQVRAMIDISDGLLQDAGHIARKSHCDIIVFLDSVPLSEGLPIPGFEALDAVTAGDDYELLFSVKPGAEAAMQELSEMLAVPLRQIGKVTAASDPSGTGEALFVRGQEEPLRVNELLPCGGFQHFRSP